MIMTRKFLTAVVWFGVALLSFAGVAVAAQVVDPAGDGSGIVEAIRPLYDAVLSGRWAFAACISLVLLTTVLRRYGAKYLPWLGTDEGGASLLLAGSFGGALATALGAAQWPTAGMLWTALTVAVSAAGGYTLVKKLGVPLLERLAKVLPAPVGAFMTMIAKVISTGIGTSPIAKAELAGKAAVAAKPGPGVASVVGTIKDVR